MTQIVAHSYRFVEEVGVRIPEAAFFPLIPKGCLRTEKNPSAGVLSGETGLLHHAMEVRGIEPLTYRLRTCRSSQLSYTPEWYRYATMEISLSQVESASFACRPG